MKELKKKKFDKFAFSQKQRLQIQMRLRHRNYVTISTSWNVYTKQLHRNCYTRFWLAGTFNVLLTSEYNLIGEACHTGDFD
jgi:hypothetical protein